MTRTILFAATYIALFAFALYGAACLIDTAAHALRGVGL